MPDIDFGQHFGLFVREQVESGRFQDVDEVVRAGLSLLENETGHLAGNEADLRRMIDEAFDDPRPSVSADVVFAELRAHHAARGQADWTGGCRPSARTDLYGEGRSLHRPHRGGMPSVGSLFPSGGVVATISAPGYA